MQSFLTSILPERGPYFIAVKTPKGFVHHPCQTFGEMEARAYEADAKGHDTFFALASYRRNRLVGQDGAVRQRTADNASMAKSFWLDIDCGPEKFRKGQGYATIPEAARALQAFIEAHGLPRPMVVMSGGGLHIYWPLTEAISKEEWQDTAQRIKAITQASNPGLLADPSRTADITSILRPVGTRNHKPERSGAMVRLLIQGPPTAPDQFMNIIKGATEKLVAKPSVRRRFELSSPQPFPETADNVRLVISALKAIDPDCEYAVWRDVIFAIKSTRWQHARSIALNWSMGKYT